ncbi:MAG: potassium transporter TrkG [Actinomycetaceae bacterium]|nr:potassium transporter TrkG [Actinomycetaceae bacterium]
MVLKAVATALRAFVDSVARKAPARLAIGIFAGIVAVSTALLQLPISTASGHRAPFVDSLFTATSAVCVTGLATVETATYWSLFGQVVIMISIKVGGLGVMTLASILALAVSRHIGLTQRMLAATEKQSKLGDVGSLVRAVVISSIVIEMAIAAVMFPRFLTLGVGVIRSAWYAVFMAISTFNNAGLVILPEGLTPYAADGWLVFPIALGTVLGALGFPVVLDVRRHWRNPKRLTLHSKLTLSTYGILAVIGSGIVGLLEWNNPDSLGALSFKGKVLTTILSGVNARSSGLATVPTGGMHEATWFLEDILMFIGGGSASTAGGIKVTTLAVMTLAIIAEARGDKDIEAFRRRIPYDVVRLSVAVAAIGAFLVAISTVIMLALTGLSLDRVLFEVVSAFATVGLSTGITPDLPESARYVLVALMFAGRTGTMTMAAALAMRQRLRVIRMPEERPAIG